MNNCYKYKFSVIIPVYKVEEYIEETIKSVLNQTIGFENNIQIIFVNDGSPDNSESICLKYQKLYPNNILYIKQENNGVSSARNNGLQYIEGKYVNFLDSDDKWAPNAYKLIYNFFENHYDEIDVVSCRVKHFEAKTTYHLLDYKFVEEGIIDINKKYDFIQLHAVSSVYKNEIVKNRLFDTNLKYGEDAKFLYEIILEKEKYGILPDAIYLYRTRANETSAMNTTVKKPSWYNDTLKNCHKYLCDLSIKKYKKVIPYVQYFVMYDLQWRLFVDPLNNITAEESLNYKKALIDLLKLIDDNIIFEQKVIDFNKKLNILNLKYNEELYKYIKIDNRKLFIKGKQLIDFENDFHPEIDVLEGRDNVLKIAGSFINMFEDENKIKIYFEDNLNNIYIPKPLNVSNNNFFVGGNIKQTGFEVSIPFKKNIKINTILEYQNKKLIVNNNYVKFGKLNNEFEHFFYSYKKYIVYNKNKKINIIKNNLLIKNYLAIKNYFYLIKIKKYKIFIIKFLARLNRIITRKQILLFSDRVSAAGDNGEYLFRYFNKQQDHYKTYFVVSRKSSDFNRIKQYGRVIDNKSLKYKILFLSKPKIISSHADGYVINPFGGSLKYYIDLYDFDYIFLQHGITMNDLAFWLNKLNKNIRLFITSAINEYNSILTNDYFYDDKVIKLTGLPRYDNLISNKEKKDVILICPTWRKVVVNDFDFSKNILRSYNETFIHTEYFQFYNNLINNEKLLKVLKAKKIKIRFILHPAVIQQAKDFKGNKFVEIIKNNVDYQEEFKKALVMVTDYSSVSFDFAYLKKPVIYSQFDEKEFFANQFDKGYFSYQRDGFGPVCYDLDTTVNEIIKSIDNKYKMNDKYLKRVEKFYKYFDTDNCKRVYEEILKLKD